MIKKIDCEDHYKNLENPICVRQRLKENCSKFNGKVENNVCKIDGFRMARSDIIFMHKPKFQGYKLMSPEKFLELSPGRGVSYNKKYMNELKEKIKNKEMDVPFLDVDIDSCQVLDHEGRHRAEASKQLGIKKIPVVIFKKEFDKDAKGMWGTKGVYFFSDRPLKCKNLKRQIPIN